MLAVVVLVFARRYFPRTAAWILVCVLLMCAGAVYDGYHYPLDVIVGAAMGLVGGIGFVPRRITSDS
jgi:membrane-associated phospholipid phosphatase